MNQAQLISIVVFAISLPLLAITLLKKRQLSVNA